LLLVLMARVVTHAPGVTQDCRMTLFLRENRGQRRVQTLVRDHLVKQVQECFERDHAHLRALNAAHGSLGYADPRTDLGLRNPSRFAQAQQAKGSLPP
jgi:hypothetical protein